MKKIVLALAFFVLSVFNVACANSNPAPFGLELNKATFDELTEKYANKYEVSDELSALNGKSIFINAEFKFEGVQVNGVIMDFDEKGVLQHIGFEVPLDKFESMCNALKKEYKVISIEKGVNYDNQPTQFAEFENETSFIRLSNLAPEEDVFDVLLVDYYTKKYESARKDKWEESSGQLHFR